MEGIESTGTGTEGAGIDGIETDGIEMAGTGIDGTETDGTRMDGIEMEGIGIDGNETVGIEIEGTDSKFSEIGNVGSGGIDNESVIDGIASKWTDDVDEDLWRADKIDIDEDKLADGSESGGRVMDGVGNGPTGIVNGTNEGVDIEGTEIDGIKFKGMDIEGIANDGMEGEFIGASEGTIGASSSEARSLSAIDLRRAGLPATSWKLANERMIKE